MEPLKTPVQYTREDISDMEVIQKIGSSSYHTTSPIYMRESFDDFCCGTYTGDYDNIENFNHLNKPASTSIANLLPTSKFEMVSYEPESYFSSMPSGSRARNIKMDGRSNFTHKQTLNHHQLHQNSMNQALKVNPHFKLKHNCVSEQSLKHNLSSPILTNIKHGKAPITSISHSPLVVRHMYDKQLAQSFTELASSSGSFRSNNIGNTPEQNSLVSLRSNSPTLMSSSRLSQYDNVDDEDELLSDSVQKHADNNENNNNNNNNMKSVNNKSKQINQNDVSLKILAQKMFKLDGFSKEDVAKQINKQTEYAQQLGSEYLTCFDFKLSTMTQSMRDFLRKIILCGETQERERILFMFSKKYHECNPGVFKSSDSCHTITCAIILLNTDLYGQNIGKKMSKQSFIRNLSGLNDGDDFDINMLRNIYQSISKDPLPIDFPSVLMTSSNQKQQQSNKANNPFLEPSNSKKGIIFKKGCLMRKACVDADGSKIPFGKRSWKMFFVTLCDMTLFLHKNDDSFQNDVTSVDDLNPDSLRIHHSLAFLPKDYQKKEFVFKLQLANWASFLFQTSNEAECQQWIEAINLAASCFSSPPLPSGVGSQMTFRKPLLPASHTKLTLFDQLQEHDKNTKKFEQEKIEHTSVRPDRGVKNRDVQNYLEKEKYLQFEQERYRVYVQVLRKNHDKLRNKERFNRMESSQKSNRTKQENNTDQKSKANPSSLYPIRSSPAIIFETKV